MRACDLILSIITLAAFLPFLVIIILILKFTGEGKVFFLQDRVGQYGRIIRVIKFVTMLENSPNMGTGSITSKNDNRILPVGRFLRKSKLNEFPQLINVIMGDMSLIGPRPHVFRDLQGVDHETVTELLKLKPGLSGVASVIFRDEEIILSDFIQPRDFYDNVIAPYKASLELWFARNRSIKLYFELICLTLISVLFGSKVRVFSNYKDLPGVPDSLKKYLGN